jgi:hypothetical protein
VQDDSIQPTLRFHQLFLAMLGVGSFPAVEPFFWSKILYTMKSVVYPK